MRNFWIRHWQRQFINLKIQIIYVTVMRKFGIFYAFNLNFNNFIYFYRMYRHGLLSVLLFLIYIAYRYIRWIKSKLTNVIENDIKIRKISFYCYFFYFHFYSVLLLLSSFFVLIERYCTKLKYNNFL